MNMKEKMKKNKVQAKGFAGEDHRTHTNTKRASFSLGFD